MVPSAWDLAVAMGGKTNLFLNDRCLVMKGSNRCGMFYSSYIMIDLSIDTIIALIKEGLPV